MADSNQMSNHPDDSPNSTKKRAGISEDEGSAVLIKDQSKRLKMESDAKYIEARNKAIDMAIALEKECINPRTKQFYVQPVDVVTKGGVETMDLQEYEKEKEKLSASSSPSSVTADLDLLVAGPEETITSYPNTQMERLINIVILSECANEELVQQYEAACRQLEEVKRRAEAHAAKIKKDKQRAEEEAKQNESIVKEAKAKASKNDIQAILALAKWHEHGRHGLKVNTHQAYLYYLKAANRGDSMGQEKAGSMRIKQTPGVTRDLRHGIDLLEMAAQGEKASGRAAYLLGFYYTHGEKLGIKSDYFLAEKWLRKVKFQRFPRPASKEDMKEAFRLLKQIEKRKRQGRMNPKSSPVTDL